MEYDVNDIVPRMEKMKNTIVQVEKVLFILDTFFRFKDVLCYYFLIGNVSDTGDRPQLLLSPSPFYMSLKLATGKAK